MAMSLFALLVSTCDPGSGKIPAKKVSKINSAYPLNTVIRFDDAWNVAYGYVHSVPRGYIAVKGSVDSIVYLSPDSMARLEFFAENPIMQLMGTFDSSSNPHLQNYYQDIESGNHRELGCCRPVQTQFRYANDTPAGEFTILGEVGEQEFI